MNRILIVDDEESIRRSLAGILSDEGFETETVADGEKALTALREGEQAPDLVLLDIAMPGMDGIETLQALREARPDLPVIMISGHGTIETAVEATRLGAFDFIEKPLDRDRLLLTLRNALDQGELRSRNEALRGRIADRYQLIGSSPAMENLRQTIRRVAATDARVLITGENGTGKELVARNLHAFSERCDGTWVEVNCAAIPQDLIESELFGHEKGAFTGAESRKIGKLEQANSGTVFLDEIGDMDLAAQAKVLRALEESTIQRVGGREILPLDVRVVAATNKDLEKEVELGTFREDLYYRLAVILISVPPLRERREDLPILAKAFVEEFCAESGARRKQIAPRAMSRLQAYGWPGNVRELRNLMERLVLMTPGPKIRAEDLPQDLGDREQREDVEGITLGEARKDFERDFLIARLRENDWNISRTAEGIGIARESLSRKVRSLEIKVPRD